MFSCIAPGSFSGGCTNTNLEYEDLKQIDVSYHSEENDQARERSIFPVGTDSTTSSVGSNFEENKDISIKIQLLGLMNGIVMETNKKRTAKIKSNASKPLDDEIFAVITGFNEALPSSDKRRVIATHLPSLPLEVKETSVSGKEHNIMALWPADFDPNGNETSSVTFNRKMKREKINSLVGIQKHKSQTCLYTTENLVLAISIRKGAEIITLGTCNVHFTGSETKATQTNLPVKTSKNSVKKAIAQMKGCKLEKKNESKKQKSMKPVSFKSDSSRSFYLAEDTVLTMLLESAEQNQCIEETNELDHSAQEIIIEDPYDLRNQDSLTQEDILIDLANSDDYVAHVAQLGSTHASTMDNVHPEYKDSKPREMTVDVSGKDVQTLAMESATNSYVLSPNRSTTSSYICASMSNDKRKSTNDDWGFAESSVGGNSDFAESWMQTHREMVMKFDFKDFDEI